MGIALVVISFSTVFVDLGFGRAVIQQHEITQIQLSTVFFLNLGISILFSGICFLLAYPAAVFFRQPLVQPVLQVLSLSFVFYGLNVVPNALLYRKMNFRAISVISVVAALISGVVGIFMAKKGYGVWSLVAQNLTAGFLTFFLTFLYLRWLPRFIIVFAGVKAMWKYSSRLFASALLDTAFTRLDIFLVGKMFSTTTLGYYSRAQSMDGVVKQMSSASIVSVLFPYISRNQSDMVKIRELYVQYLHVISFVAFFLYGFLYVCADSIFTILFTARWAEAAVLFKIMTIAGFVYPVSSLMVSILSARGNSKAFLRAEVFKKMIILPAYIFGFFVGLHTFVYCLAIAYILALAVNVFFVYKEIFILPAAQFKIILIYGFVTLVIVLLIRLFSNLLPAGAWANLFLNGLVFTALFFIVHVIAQTTGYHFLITKAKSFLKK